MVQTIYDILNSQAFWFLVIIWLIICFAWKSRRDELLDRWKDLMSKPVVFDEDKNPDSVPFYPRRNLERVAAAFKSAMIQPLTEIINNFRKWIQYQVGLVHTSERPFRIFGYLILLVLLILFIWADAVAIVNTLDILGFFKNAVIPDFLKNIDVSLVMGSLGASIVSIWILGEIIGDKSNWTDWENHNTTWREVGKRIAILLAISGIVVAIFLGMQRVLSVGGYQEYQGFMGFAIQIVTLAIVPLNSFITAALIFPEGLKGALVVLLFAQVILLGLIYIINYTATLLAYILPFVVDILWRFILFLLDLLFYIILTPIELVIKLITSPFGGSQKEDEKKLPKPGPKGK